jgi:hypothetical protein
VGLAPTGKRRLITAHTHDRHLRIPWMGPPLLVPLGQAFKKPDTLSHKLGDRFAFVYDEDVQRLQGSIADNFGACMRNVPGIDYRHACFEGNELPIRLLERPTFEHVYDLFSRVDVSSDCRARRHLKEVHNYCPCASRLNRPFSIRF